MWYPRVNMHKRKMTYKLTLDAADDNMRETHVVDSVLLEACG